MTAQAVFLNRRSDTGKIDIQRPVSMVALLTVAVLVMLRFCRVVTGTTIHLGCFIALGMIGMAITALNLGGVRATSGLELLDHPIVAILTFLIDQPAQVTGESAGTAQKDEQQTEGCEPDKQRDHHFKPSQTQWPIKAGNHRRNQKFKLGRTRPQHTLTADNSPQD